jgi:hypothetical protein
MMFIVPSLAVTDISISISFSDMAQTLAQSREVIQKTMHPGGR